MILGFSIPFNMSFFFLLHDFGGSKQAKRFTVLIASLLTAASVLTAEQWKSSNPLLKGSERKLDICF